MKRIFKTISYITITALFCIALSGCGASNQTEDTKKIVVWSFEDQDVWKPVIKNFQLKNKDYTVVYEQQKFDSNYENKVLNSVLSSGTPDVWAMPNDWVYRHKDKLAPLPEATAEAIDLSATFVSCIEESVVFNDKIYALSPTAEPLLVYYNPKIFSDTMDNFNSDKQHDKEEKKRVSTLLQEPPKTWSDFIDAARLLTRREGDTIVQSGVALGTSNISNSEDILYLLMLQNETDIISSNHTLSTFNLPKNTSTGANDIPGQRALEFYTSFANPLSANYLWNDSLGDNIEAFGAGKVAMIFGYPSLQNTLLQKFPNLRYKKGYVPQVYIESDKIKDFARFNAFGVNKLAKNTNAGWSLITSLIGDSLGEFASGAKLYSSKKPPSYEISINQRSGTNPEKLELATASSLVRGRFPEEFDEEIRNMVSTVNLGMQVPRIALDLSASKTTDLLRQEGW